MKQLLEPTEIDQYHYPWQAPLTKIIEGCFGARRYTTVIEPDDLSVLERKLFEANPDDFEWARDKIKDLPDYLTKYFVTRYISVFNKKGRKQANLFLRERMGPAAERALIVVRIYKKLPTTQKVALLSEEYNDTEQSGFETKAQMQFDFEHAERNRKPIKSRLLAELELSEVKEMAFKLSQITNTKFNLIVERITREENLDDAPPEVVGYEELAEFIRQFGIAPPRKQKNQTDLTALSDMSRMLAEDWWYRRLTKIRKIMREHLAIAMGQVSSKASPYASWDCIREHREQQTSNWKFIQQSELLDEETGETTELEAMVLKSVSNPAIRRHELMVRCRGCEDIGNELGLQGLFLTLTAPSKYHNSYKKGGFISHWSGASPRDTQAYLNNVWKRVRAKLGRDQLRWFGLRVAEPHHDGTPHWHLLIWVKPEDKDAITKVFVDYATQEDKHELIDKRGIFDHTPRCDVGEIDPEKGTATGYIAKYISKNIDGYAMDDEVSDETGKAVKDMAKNVTAWKSRWSIRQFQFFGGAPVTTYRELRRFANQNKKAFMEYLFRQQRSDLLTIYSMLQRELVGPIKPSKLISNEELVKVIGASFQSRIKTDQPSIKETLIAADEGNWQGYIMGQGGPFVKREDLLIVNSYEVLPFASPHGEDVRKISGFSTPEETIKTRTKVWTIQKKSTDNTSAEASPSGSEATVNGAFGSSRSPVNNCTGYPRKVIESIKNTITQVIGAVFATDYNAELLASGKIIKIDKVDSYQLRSMKTPDSPNAPYELVSLHTEPIRDDFDWWDEPTLSPSKQEVQPQPDLKPSLFYADDDWPLV